MEVRKALFIVLALVLIAAIILSCYMGAQFEQVKQVDIPNTNEELSIDTNQDDRSENITNIALFGVDRRNDQKAGRSDSIIILSIDEKQNKIKLSSIMRDTYVDVEGYGMTKINHAYAYDGPVLAIRTLNSNFNLNIKDYVAVDIEGFKDIVDSIGGIPMYIKSYEVSEFKKTGILTSGTYKLNGSQALTYARIRHHGNADFERTDRQRAVLSAIFNKLKGKDIKESVLLVKGLLPYTETSLTSKDIVQLATSFSASDINEIDHLRFPADGDCHGEMINGVYYLVTDLEITAKQINKFIYDDLKPEEK